MSNKVKNIIIAVAVAVIAVVIALFTVHFVTRKNTDGGVSDSGATTKELSGKFTDENGKEMLMSATYAMPKAMTLSDLQPDTIAQITLTATITPTNATNDRVIWEIIDTRDNGVCTAAELVPTFYGSKTAVLTVTDTFDSTYKIIATSAADETIYDTCYVDYLKDFNWLDLDIENYNNDLVFGKNEIIPVDYDDGYANGSISGDVEYGEFSMTLNGGLINDISDRLGSDFTPIYQPVNENFSSDGIPYYLSSPYACFAGGSGLDEYDFNLAFCRSVYFFNDEYPPVYISFTARYSYGDKLITSERINLDNSFEKLYMEFSLDGLYVPVQDIVINNEDIIINAGETSEPLTCYFDNADSSVISTSAQITVAGKQSTCTATNVTALNKSFTKYLKMESGTQVTFTTAATMTLKIYVDTAGKRIKVDGANYTGVADGNGDNVITVELAGGSHTISKGDVLGLFGLTLENA
ncbi:MAG: hypothetical protein NC131_00485 [Roseburia sp.]|nr:hypothetical protein [Roseburia sp.]